MKNLKGLLMDGTNHSFKFKSSLSGSNGCSGGCWSKKKLPGHIISVAFSNPQGPHAIANPVLASLNLDTIAIPSLLGFCTSEWDRTPSDLIMELLKGKPTIVFVADWYFLATPLSLLWAFWWPPSACELKNFLMQKLHRKTLEFFDLDCELESSGCEDRFLPRLKFSHSWWWPSMVSLLKVIAFWKTSVWG